MKQQNIISIVFLALLSSNTYAATVDGVISNVNEYQWNTDIEAVGGDKWASKKGTTEYNDASGGDDWDINYLGTDVSNGQFQFGAIGGKILSGQETNDGSDIYLGDFAISVDGSSDPTIDSSGFQYAIHLNSIVGDVANFSLLTDGQWTAANLYNNDNHKSETYQMSGGTELLNFNGVWTTGTGADNSVLEGGFDISWLGLFDPSAGGTLSTYITMACVNDEALVHAEVSAVPIPAALWLFTPVLVGFMGLRRRTKATV